MGDRHITTHASLFTRSPLEDDWLICCEQLDIPKPDDVNVEICGVPVDGGYYDAKLIIELDGVDNHRSPAQVRRDRHNELDLRGTRAGWCCATALTSSATKPSASARRSFTISHPCRPRKRASRGKKKEKKRRAPQDKKDRNRRQH